MPLNPTRSRRPPQPAAAHVACDGLTRRGGRRGRHRPRGRRFVAAPSTDRRPRTGPRPRKAGPRRPAGAAGGRATGNGSGARSGGGPGPSARRGRSPGGWRATSAPPGSSPGSTTHADYGATTRYRVYDLGPYPGLVRDDAHGLAVAGELWDVSARALGELDDFETDADEFARGPVEVAGVDGPVEAYFYVGPVPAGATSGDRWPLASGAVRPDVGTGRVES